MPSFQIIFIAVNIITSKCALTQFQLSYGSTQHDDYAQLCAPNIRCDRNARYRSINGSCNNLKTPWLGASKTPHLRILNAYYDDGKYQFRKQMDGTPLPNARAIQLEMFLFKQFPYENDHNVLFMEWGQFIAHDVTDLPPDISMGSDCCELQKKKPVPLQCQAVIKVPENDRFYLERGQTCINFNRAVTSATDGCPLTPTAFMVHVTHFIDGSQVYGSDDGHAADLRSFEGGRLKSDFFGDQQQEFCPQRNRTSWKCDTSQRSNLCFVAGDRRVNQNLGIALFQNMFLRFHNIVAFHLHQLNSFWSDETVYQETRRIVVAVIQHITYSYYLPTLLGENFVASNGFYERTVYDENVNPSTTIENSAAAFRVLHNLIPAYLNLIDDNHFDYHRVLLTDWMNKPDLLPSSNNFDHLLRGFLETYTREQQASYNPMTAPRFNGHDLLSADVQRGLDTGVPPYNKMRSFCGIPEAQTFDDLLDLIAYEDVEKLKYLYSSVDDVDLIVGALLEIPEQGAQIGHTSRCIIADSFYRYKIGDRFFYDVRNQPGSFTTEQLQTLKNVNFGHVICATSNLQYLPEDVFMPFTSKFNGRKYNCDGFFLNLDAWKDYSNYYST